MVEMFLVSMVAARLWIYSTGDYRRLTAVKLDADGLIRRSAAGRRSSPRGIIAKNGECCQLAGLRAVGVVVQFFGNELLGVKETTDEKISSLGHSHSRKERG